MTEQEDLNAWASDCEQIRQTVALYCQLLDDQRYVELSELFCEDAELPWEGLTLRGREEISARMQETQQPRGETRHLPFTPVIERSGEEARVWCDVIVTVHPSDAPAMIGWLGRYQDRFKIEEGRWRFFRHIAVGHGETIPVGARPSPGRVPVPG